MRIKKSVRGFTLIELMIVIAIVGILASVAMPQYRLYVNRAAFTEIQIATAPIKAQIETCYALNSGPGDSNECNQISPGSPQVRGQVTQPMLDRAADGASITSVQLNSNTAPTILVTPTVQNGILSTDTFTLTGTLDPSGESISQWDASGVACNKGYC